MLGDADEAADAAQEAFVRAYRALPNFRGDSAFGTWLHRIAANVAVDAAARLKRRPLSLDAPVDDASDRPGFDAPDPAAGPESVALRGERRSAVRQALAQLPENQRVVLVLFDIQGHSYEEAAQLLKLPMGTVKSRLNRARLALRELLEPSRELFLD
jgi:RNA polymerase sigma-70 factor (ECF subfamily)